MNKKEPAKNKFKTPLLLVLLIAAVLFTAFFLYLNNRHALAPIELNLSNKSHSPEEVKTPSVEASLVHNANPPHPKLENKNSCPPVVCDCLQQFKQISLAIDIRESIYQNQSIQSQLDQLMQLAKDNEHIRKNIDILQGIEATSPPTFAILKEEFQPISKSLIINEKLNEETNAWSRLFYHMLYKIIQVKHRGSSPTPLEVNILKLQIALDNHDIITAKEAIDQIQSQDEGYKLWLEKFISLYKELSSINHIIAKLLETN